MRTRLIIISLILFCISIFNMGCWDSTDIEDMSIPYITGFDTPHIAKDQNIDNARVAVTFLRPNFDQPGGKLATDRLVGTTIGETRNKWAFNSPNIAILGGAQATLLGEQLAREGFLTDMLIRQPTIKHAMIIGVVEGRADVLIEEANKASSVNLGDYITRLLRTSSLEAFTVKSNLHRFFIDVVTPGRNPVMPLIELTNAKEVRISGAAIFKKKKLIAKIDQNETRALVLLSGQKASGYIPFEIKEKGKLVDTGTVYMSNSRKVSVTRKNGKYYFDITVKLKGDLLEHENIQTFDTMVDYNRKIVKAVQQKIQNECKDFLIQMQNEFKVDCINISKYAMAKWRRELEKTIDDEEFISNAVIKVRVDVNLDDIGERT